ncbi:MAG: reprolysin-like metallopeptidase, partial [Ardenticatenaceae bacterium]
MKRTELFVMLSALVFMLGVLLPTIGSANSSRRPLDQGGIWYDVNEGAIRGSGERLIIPTRYRMLAADVSALDGLLAQAPQENTPAADSAPLIMSLPLPDGQIKGFAVSESPIMAPELAAKYPEIKTYLGQGIDDPTATVRFDRTPAGFHAMILSSEGTIYIDPYARGDLTHYISYFKRDFERDSQERRLPDQVLPNPAGNALLSELDQLNISAVGEQLRTYRLAMAATGEYTQFHGGTVAQALAAINTTVNRVNGIYEREVSVRLQLINNNDQIIYTNSGSDPYNNDDGFVMLAENQETLDSVIGSANYDVGHVVSTGGGGVAYLGVICDSGLKGSGVTGSSQPVGDPFDVDYVAHELGHQFGANHTFNGTTNACRPPNRNGSTAYEPGSASTIMGYAGICGNEDLQANSDDYFHAISFDEMVAHVTSGSGNSCGTTSATNNNPPTVDAGSTYHIPVETPFMLTGSASDPNGDSLTYGWEQFDLGNPSPPHADDGNRPIFRTFNPVAGASRTFPKLSDILNNNSTFGESLPTTNRDLTFRLTVRDNKGGVGHDSVTLKVNNSAGPFAVTAPNTSLTWNGGSQQSVTWDVADTTDAPISCSSVHILLSTDGGSTFSQTLASGTANDGSETISVPNAPTSSARVKVACANNIFFDISNANFTITEGGAANTATPTTANPTATATNTPTAPSSTATATATNTPSAPSSTATATPTGEVCEPLLQNGGFEEIDDNGQA